MSRLRLNQELRNKISSRWRVHAEQEETDEKEKYFKSRESIKPEQDKAWNLAHTIVRRHYTESDVEKARYLPDKFDNVDTSASDSSFHLGYMGEVESRDETDRPIIEEKSCKPQAPSCKLDKGPEILQDEFMKDKTLIVNKKNVYGNE